MILPKLPFRTESGLMIVKVRFAIAARIIASLLEIDRENQREGGALSRRRLHVDAPVVQLDEVARQREAQAGAATARAASLLGLVELVEDALQLLGRDADAPVGHVD